MMNRKRRKKNGENLCKSSNECNYLMKKMVKNEKLN